MDTSKAPAHVTRTAVIIEDESDIRSVLMEIFSAAGFIVHTFGTGLEGVEGVRHQHPDVVTLDLGLGDIDGFEVARRVRLFSDAYILILTASTQELDTLLGFEAGADDYVTKPFRPRELTYRVEALLRRPRTRSDSQIPSTAVQAEPASPEEPTTSFQTPALEALEHNGLRLSPRTRTVELSGLELSLTRSEFDLLLALLRSGRTVCTKLQLARILHGEQSGQDGYWSEADGQAVHVHVANLRRKLGDSALSPRWVETVRGVGYRLAVVQGV
ncbi:response regulator transcription factor [Paenarthrobacter sp. RAF54_2]|uniref:response regulator transcription factor n=1 Tax=Paenarthrobacter sp. RAF54_2 TaxID=3233061 RepID=UPI003F98A874